MIVDKLVRHLILSKMQNEGRNPVFREVTSDTESLKYLEVELREKFEELFKKKKFVTLLEVSARFIDALILYLRVKNITLKMVQGERERIKEREGSLESRNLLISVDEPLKKRRRPSSCRPESSS